MSDVAPRPWRVAIFEDEPDERYIVDANGQKFDHTDEVVMYVMKCVNEYDELKVRAEKAEAEATHHKNQAESNQQAYNDMHDAQLNMVKVNRELTKRAEKAEAEIERLRGALKIYVDLLHICDDESQGLSIIDTLHKYHAEHEELIKKDVSTEEIERLKAENEYLTKNRNELAFLLDDCQIKRNQLEAEIEQLRQERDSQQRCAIKAMEENQQLQSQVKEYRYTLIAQSQEIADLRRTLRKCSPRSMPSGVCEFCRYGEHAGHKPNCEYVKMIGGVEQDERLSI